MPVLQSRQGLGAASAAAPAALPNGVDPATAAHIQGVAAAAGLTSIGTSTPEPAGTDDATAAGANVVAAATCTGHLRRVACLMNSSIFRLVKCDDESSIVVAAEPGALEMEEAARKRSIARLQQLLDASGGIADPDKAGDTSAVRRLFSESVCSCRVFRAFIA